MAGTRIPMREVVGRSNPLQVHGFGERVHQKLIVDNQAKQEARQRSGKVSGGKLGKPTLWAVLDILGVPDEKDPYILGKFQRGNDVEDRAIEMLTNIDPTRTDNGVWVEVPEGSVIDGKVMLQKPGSYRNGVGAIDLSQIRPDGEMIYHEIKSVTKMAYDKVAATGRSAYKKTADGESAKGTPEAYYHHEIQLAYYCLGDDIKRGVLHYLNADDYRLTSFIINPLDYKEEIDKEIDDIELAFITKRLPAFEGFLAFHKLKAYWSYKEWNELSPGQMLDKLQRQFPEQYNKFREMTL